MVRIHHHPLRLRANPSRVVVRPFHRAWHNSKANVERTERLVDQILAMGESLVEAQRAYVLKDFEARHWQTRRVFMKRCREIEYLVGRDFSVPDKVRELIGAYFCNEYSYAAAAIMNPSVVPHYDQSGLATGSLRIILSLRTVGEGHISTISFREGIITDAGGLELASEPPFATAADPFDELEDRPPEGKVTVHRHVDSTLSGTVIFPVTPRQRNGLEDLRLVKFDEDGSSEWIGTYTAYSGYDIQTELLRTSDFHSFELVPTLGGAVQAKGMALFPRKVNGHYMMLGRQDGETISLLQSHSLDQWDEADRLMGPVYPWEFVQMGNCGSPIELDEGWLVLTHGVGAMRKYTIGAALLDKQDPAKVLARTAQPVLTALENDREGYVPNVVYSCGALKHGDLIFLPYGIADSSVAFAFLPIRELLEAMS